MKRLNFFLGMAIATTLLFTSCDKDKMYEKKIVGEWAAINPDGIGNPAVDYLTGAFETFGSYPIFRSDNYYTVTLGTGWSNCCDDVQDTLYIPTTIDYWTWTINNNTLSLNHSANNPALELKIVSINETEMILKSTENGAETYYRKITEEDMVYIWLE